MKKVTKALLVLSLMTVVLLAACTSGNQAQDEPSGKNEPASAAVAEGSAADEPITVNQELPDGEIISTGPHGEKAVSAKTLILTPEEVQKIRDGNYTAAIALHLRNDWTTAQTNGLKDTFAKLGVEVVAITDGQFKAEKQVSDLETILAKKPDILVGFPVDSVSMAPSFKKVAEAGVKIVFMDNPAADMEAGKDYVSVVSADNYGNGVVAARILGNSLGGKGEIATLHLAADFFVTNQRSEAFEKTIQEEFPDIKIVEKGGFADANKAVEVASGILTKHPDLDGMFAVWDGPAEGILAAARTIGRTDLKVSTIDLGTNVAINIAEGDLIQGLGAQLPYDQGIAEAILAAYSILGKEAPPYVAVPALEVNKDNIVDAWKTVYHAEPPQMILDALKK